LCFTTPEQAPRGRRSKLQEIHRDEQAFLVGLCRPLRPWCWQSGTAQAQQFLRIGTGGTAGTYYPVGGMIANAVSQPGKLVVTAQASNGSLANVTGIAGGALESGFSQADVASWAYTGKGVFEGKPKITGLRLIANLYPESVHIVVRKGSGIKTVADLKGKRVALDEPGSGTLINARTILAAYGIKEADIKPEYIKPNQAGDKLKDGALDAFFFTGGSPAGAIAELASAGTGIELLPIDGPQADALRQSDGFFAPDLIAEGTYKGVGSTKTLAVGAQWVTSDKADVNAVYEITKALFSDAGQKAMAAGHAKASSSPRKTPCAVRASRSIRVLKSSTRK
jgi:TRAP transporter TAXI family solute receptor